MLRERLHRRCRPAVGAAWGIGFTPSILAHARRRRDGWSLHSTGRRGDLALLYGSMGGDPVEHVEIVVKRLSDTRYATIGGNTSSGNGSQSDGAMAARRERATTGRLRIIGFARPPYPAWEPHRPRGAALRCARGS